MENKYLPAGTKVTVNNFIGVTVGLTIFSEKLIKVKFKNSIIVKDFHRKDVELYVAPYIPRKLFKTHKKATVEEKLIAKLLQATSHENVIKTALSTLDAQDKSFFTITHSPSTATSKWTLLMPKGLSPTEKIPVLIAHTDLHPSLKHPTKDNLEYENGTFTSPTGLGADDRAGIFAITQLLPHMSYMPFAVLFPDEEEIGLKGTYAFTRTKDFTEVDNHASMYISIDRRRNKNGKASLATYGSNNDKLNKRVSKLLEREIIKGSSTDCKAMSTASTNKVPCFNLSCGYDNEHTKNEILYFSELKDTVLDLFTLLADDSIVGTSHPVDVTPLYNTNYYTQESSIYVNTELFKKNHIQDLLDIYLYYTGRHYSVNKASTNEIIPDILLGTIMKLNPLVVENQKIGGELVTSEMFTTLKTDLWEIETYNSNLKVDLKGITMGLTCTNVPYSWLEEVLKDEPQFEN